MVLILVIFTGCSSNQATESNKLNVTIENAENLNSYQRDFIYLLKVLEDSHPNIYENFHKNDFDREKEKFLEEFGNMNDNTDYQIKLQQFVSRIGDAHTNIIMNFLFDSPVKYPVHFLWIKENLYITDLDKKLSDKWIGSQVLKIDKYSTKECTKRCGSIISAENEIWKKTQLTNYFRNPDFLTLMKISESADSLCLTILINNKEEEITLYPQKKVKWKNSIPEHEITAKRYKPHSYKILKNEKTCYYQFNSFIDRQTSKSYVKRMINWYMRPLVNLIISNNYPNYNKFLDEMFKTMSKNDVEKIIVDLRYNGGGNSILGNLFMYHCDIPDTIQDYSGGAIKISELFKQSYKNSYEYFKKDFLAKNEEKKFKIPKLIELDREEINDDYSFFKNIEEGNTPWKVKPVNDKFKGKIILLIGQNTFSSASMYATILSDNKQATLIGEPIGQKPTSFGDLLIFTLPETNIRATVSHKIFLRPDSSKDSDPTLYPDIEIYPTIEEYLNGKDPVFEKALGL
jgi:hypothetical protein